MTCLPPGRGRVQLKVYDLRPAASIHSLRGVIGLQNPVEIVSGDARARVAWKCAGLALLLLALRWPFIDHPRPVHPDEESFVAAVGFPDQYPVQHPGYPGWVGLGTLLASLGVDRYAAYAAWSMAASALAPSAAYLFNRRFVSDGAAWWLALALGVSPLMWFLSVTALAYPMGTLFGVVTALLAIEAIRVRRSSYLIAALAVLCAGTLVRGDLPVYLILLVLMAAPGAIERRRAWVVALLPLVILLVIVGGSWWTTREMDDALVAARLSHTRDVMLNTSVFRAGLVDGLVRNLVKIGVNLGWDLGLAFPLFLFSAAYLVLRRRVIGEGFRVVAAWLLPGLIFLACFHVVQGYFLVLLPAVFLCIGLAMEHRWGERTARLVAIGVAVASAAQFLFYPWSPESSGWKRTVDGKIAFISREGLMHIDRRSWIHEDGDVWRTGAHGAERE